MKAISIFGITNSGKTTLIEEALKWQNVAAAQVGKEFRRRYSAGHFKGQGAPAHTEKEALDILDMFTRQARNVGASVFLIDGQPRRADQVLPVLDRFPDLTVLWLQVDDDEAERRARARNPFDKEALQLSLDRLKNDKIQLWSVVERLVYLDVKIIPVRSTHNALGYVGSYV